MAVRRQTLKGFTLVELLIVITIMGLVVGAATYGYSLFTRHWDTSFRSFQRARAQFQRLDLLQQAISDCIPWAVRDEGGKIGFYFLGRDEGLTLVSGSPVFSPGEPAVIRVFREPDGEGRWQLVYEEAPLRGVQLRQGNQQLPFQHRMIVMRGLKSLSFRFFGWSSAAERAAAGEGLALETPRWFEEFDGLRRSLHPQKLGLLLNDAEIVFEVPDRAQIAADRLVQGI